MCSRSLRLRVWIFHIQAKLKNLWLSSQIGHIFIFPVVLTVGFILLSSQGLSSRFRDRIGLNSFSPLLCLSTLETKKIVYFDIKFIQSFDMRHSRSSNFWFKHLQLSISFIRIVYRCNINIDSFGYYFRFNAMWRGQKYNHCLKETVEMGKTGCCWLRRRPTSMHLLQGWIEGTQMANLLLYLWRLIIK